MQRSNSQKNVTAAQKVQVMFQTLKVWLKTQNHKFVLGDEFFLSTQKILSKFVYLASRTVFF